MRKRTIDSFFTKKNSQTNTSAPSNLIESSIIDNETFVHEEERPTKVPWLDGKEVDINSLKCDPGKRPPMWSYLVNQQGEIWRAYVKVGPYQHMMSEYHFDEKLDRCFQASWFKLFPEWLEYSPRKDAAFCLPCYLFNKSSRCVGLEAFTIEGFRKWKKVNDGENCAFLSHIGKDPNSLHKKAIMHSRDLWIKQNIFRMLWISKPLCKLPTIDWY